jgi:uncharacterized membrane protein
VTDTAHQTHTHVGESRWLAAVVIVIAMVLQFRLPERLSIGPSAAVPLVTGVLLILLLALAPGRFGTHHRNLRKPAIALVVILNIGNATSLGLLIYELVHKSTLTGRRLLFAAVEIWFTSVIVYGLWLWELDRGGPAARATGHDLSPDLLFPQMTESTWSPPNWHPRLVDYLYVSLTNSTAFSPTDTMPLTPRIKLLLGAQSITSLATVALVGARAVNVLQ